MTRSVLLTLLTIATAPLVFGCANNKSSAAPGKGGGSAGGGEDAANSTSAIAAAVASGAAAQGSGVNVGLYTPKSRLQKLWQLLTPVSTAWAATACPTYAAPGTATCTGSGNQLMNLDYVNCSFGTSAASWNGGETLLFGNSAICGTTTLPIIASGDTLIRTFSGSIPGSNPTQRTGPGGFVVSLDTQTPFGYVVNVAGGIEVTGNGTGHSIAILGVHLLSTLWDHSVSTFANAPLVVVNPGQTRTIQSGTVMVQHNLAQYTGSAVFSNVGYVSGSCFPQSGTITTTFSGTLTGTEILTFTGGGNATLAGVNGVSTAFALTHCF